MVEKAAWLRRPLAPARWSALLRDGLLVITIGCGSFARFRGRVPAARLDSEMPLRTVGTFGGDGTRSLDVDASILARFAL